MNTEISFQDWESGKVKLSDEYFAPMLGNVIGCSYINDEVILHREVLGYRGTETGTRLGLWFADVME